MGNKQEATISLAVHSKGSHTLLESFFLWCAKLFGGDKVVASKILIESEGVNLEILAWSSGGIAMVKINGKETFWTTCVTPVKVATIK